MLVVLVEQQARNDVRDTFQICQDVRAELERSLEAGEVVPGTPMFDTVHR
ncbi:hypothetical protein A2U01_0116227, partial [Trifolium medium]|nr:hypothetical protein [Trifolium medium]